MSGVKNRMWEMECADSNLCGALVSVESVGVERNNRTEGRTAERGGVTPVALSDGRGLGSNHGRVPTLGRGDLTFWRVNLRGVVYKSRSRRGELGDICATRRRAGVQICASLQLQEKEAKTHLEDGGVEWRPQSEVASAELQDEGGVAEEGRLRGGVGEGKGGGSSQAWARRGTQQLAAQRASPEGRGQGAGKDEKLCKLCGLPRLPASARALACQLLPISTTLPRAPRLVPCNAKQVATPPAPQTP
jgi:hypothetical protein